ncbi:hypothetical protein AUJ87_04240 [Candidatus Gracilibacteria bacterium CG1_02_38_174]|nr:MAG: hypothetical protein AUJ87_04240 [Candidatus Gracilibacteria bacterium CG1_02_38_174]PIQ12215.1 MAG: hypothetical protein COW68_00515 [Candidatus Gracilibacteria bacterium CG18_big_fil_WC_8_21_14_2_50_38_16]PIQ40949.1 MAG: hypothetical protein COW06_04475 [Candidatus Gracilibacteria bacterium CG12_big_fil_rev_8_21_14_0_65_38_15]PIZ01982.1 MAG: hypothetical protein COY60_00690 [Candidatus Gracilibacteria bacterium CG_4_10_14_0_8_um_filter_38_28]
MKTLSFWKKSIYSAVIFFSTLLVLSVGYGALFGGLTVADKVGTGSGLTATAWNRIVDGVLDINTRLENLSFSGENVGIGVNPTSRLTIGGSTPSGGILIYDNRASNPSPVLEVQGRRSDNNSSQTFGGGLALAGLNTQGAVTSGKRLGTIYFGGNQTNGTESNLLYSASISGYADNIFNSSSDMPTGLAFYTGPTGLPLGTTNASYGTERVRIDSSGNVGIGTINPKSKLHVVGLPVYTNNANAIAGGLTVGAFYRNGADPDVVCVVH